MQLLWILVGIFSFFVHFLLILGTDRLCRHKTNCTDAMLASLLGGLHAAVCTFSSFSFLAQAHWRLIFLVLTSLTAFRREGDLLRRGALFVLLQLSVGEIAMGEVWPFVLAAAAICLLCRTGFGPESPGRQMVSVTITHEQKQITLKALVDTGNELKDPVSGCKVLVVDHSVARALLGLSQKELAFPIETFAAHFVPGLRLIPYHSVGQPSGFLLGFRPQKICIDGVPTQQILAFAPHSIGTGKLYQALVGGIV